jgi:hypothetical protein
MGIGVFVQSPNNRLTIVVDEPSSKDTLNEVGRSAVERPLSPSSITQLVALLVSQSLLSLEVAHEPP